MSKVYHSKFTFDKFETYVIYGVALVIIVGIFLILSLKIYTVKTKIVSLAVLLLGLGLPGLSLLFLWNIKIIVQANMLVWKRIDKTVEVKWNDVKKVEKLWRPNAGIAYYIVTEKHRLNVPRNIENYNDLFKEIKKHTGKGVRGEFQK